MTSLDPTTTGISIGLASVPEVDRIWPMVALGLEDACRRSGGDLTADYLWRECRSGAAFLVIVSRPSSEAERRDILAASVWQFQKWTVSGKVLKCLALYGREMKTWLQPHFEFTKAMAKIGGATSLVTEGRQGFQRMFPAARVLRQVYELEI